MIYYQRLESDSGELVLDKFTEEIVLSTTVYSDEIGDLMIDDPIYLIETLYPLCINFKKNTLSDKDSEEINNLNINFKILIDNEVIELLEEAIKKNWL